MCPIEPHFSLDCTYALYSCSWCTFRLLQLSKKSINWRIARSGLCQVPVNVSCIQKYVCKWTKNVFRNYLSFFLSFFWRCDSTRAMASSFMRHLDRTQRRTTFGRTPLDEWSCRRRDLYLTTTHNTQNRQDIHAHGGVRTHNLSRRAALYRAAIGTCDSKLYLLHYCKSLYPCQK